jgi:hypothetical protein
MCTPGFVNFEETRVLLPGRRERCRRPRQPPRALPKPEALPLNEEARARLEALGYLH